MSAAPGRAHGKRVQLTISLDPQIHEWVSRNAGPGREFKDFTHAVERGLVLLQEYLALRDAKAPTLQELAMRVEDEEIEHARRAREEGKRAPGRPDRGSSSKK